MTPMESTVNNIITYYKSSSTGVTWSELALSHLLSTLSNDEDFHSKYEVFLCKLSIHLIKKQTNEILELIREFCNFADNAIQAVSVPQVTSKENNLINAYMRFLCFSSRSLYATGHTQYAWFVFRRGRVLSRRLGINFPVTDDRVLIGFYNGMPNWN